MNAVFLHHRADKADAARFLAKPAPVSAFAALERIESYREPKVKRSLIRFEYAAWKNGEYSPEFEDLNRYDACTTLLDMRQRVRSEGALMFKTSDGYYCEVQS